MAIYDNERLVIKVCKLFYEDNFSQKEIAALLNISKPQICRMLNYAREHNIVRFQIDNPYEQEFLLERKLQERYHLDEVYVFRFDYSTKEEMLQKLGLHCANQLDKYFSSNHTVGVMSGKTIAAIAESAHRLNREGLEFVPLIGNLGTSGHDWYANLIARTFCEHAGGSYHFLNAPVLVQNEQVSALFRQEPSIKAILDKGRQCNIALVGIGDISPDSTGFLSGAFSKDDILELTQQNVCASVCTSYITSDGTIVDGNLGKRSIGVSLDELHSSQVIAVAAGLEKINAIHAALNSHAISIFMTTMETAARLLEN